MSIRSINAFLCVVALAAGAHANACGVSQSTPGVLILTVGSPGCMANAADMAKMATALKSAIVTMPAAAGSAGQSGVHAGLPERTTNAQKLYNIADKLDQARFLSGLPHHDGYYTYPMKH